MKTIKLIFINFLIFTFLLIILDPIVGKIYFNGNDTSLTSSSRYISLREHDQNLNRISVANINGINKKEVQFNTDSEGFILGPNNTENSHDAIDIVFIGGSTTECYFVEPKNRFPYLVGEVLSEKYNNRFVSVNAGMAGNNTIHSVMIFISKIIKMKPKKVFFLHNVNDLSLLSKTGSYWDAPTSRSIILDNDNSDDPSIIYGFLKSIKDTFFSNIYSLLKKSIGIKGNFFYENLNIENDEFIDYRDNFYLKNPEDIQKVKDSFKKALELFVSTSKIYGIEPILATQFNRIEDNSPYFKKHFLNLGYKVSEIDYIRETYKDFNQIIIETSLKYDINFIDLNKLVPKNEEYIYDTVHLTDKGSILVSNLISNFLIENYPIN